ncbi:MAG TPA: kelch repeat-containing protein, partial [Candidatus Hydrogenedentes bacterium]|nr:kelch repeat-containing protein [Candidatus Hydrogenedentota bacterium]
MQDNHANILDGWLVSALGFCSGTDDDWKPGKYPRGFLDKVWALNLPGKAASWIELPPFPGGARQAAQGACIGGELYLWGGFNYTEPHTYADGYKLSRKSGDWKWSPLPPLPSPSSWAGMSALGSKIYCVGGADYDGERFYTLQDRSGKVSRLGARLIVFDTDAPEKGWIEKSPLPGTPRCLTTAAPVDGKIYVVGGMSAMENGGYSNVVDTWRYDPASDAWDRLRDMPISASGSSSSTIVYKNRYLLLPCGYQYGAVMRPDGSIENSYGTPEKVKRTWKSHPMFATTHYYNHHFVYDTRTNLFGTATSLPTDDVATITVVEGDTVYMLPGETGGFEWNGEYFGHHPEFVLIGTAKELDWE